MVLYATTHEPLTKIIAIVSCCRCIRRLAEVPRQGKVEGQPASAFTHVKSPILLLPP